MALGHGPRCHHSCGGSLGHPDQYDPCGSMALGHRYGLRWLTKPQASARTLEITRTANIKSDPSYYWTKDPGYGPLQQPELDDTTTCWQLRFLRSAWPSVTNMASRGGSDPEHLLGLQW